MRRNIAGRLFGAALFSMLAACGARAQILDTGAGHVPNCMGSQFVKGPSSCATPSGTGGTVQTGDNPAVGQYVGSGSTTIGPATISGDGTLASGGALTVTKSNGTSFGTAAFATIGTSGATVPLNNGNLTLSGTDNFTGTFEIGGFSLTMNGAITLPAAPVDTECLHISSAGSITPTGSDCGSGGGGGSGTVNSGSNPAIAQYIGSSSQTVGPVTVSGDATIANGGAVTLATVNAGPGSTTCSNITVNGKGLVTSNVSGSCGGSPGFNTIGSGTNTTAAMLVGTGGSLGATGSGTIAATAVPAAGITGTIAAGTMLPLASARLYVGNGSNVPAAVALSGDCTISNAGAITCTKSGGTGFGTAAFVNTGTTGGTLGLLNGNLTLSGTDNFTGTFEIGGFSLGLGGNTTLPAAPGSTACLHMSSAGAITTTGGDCASAPTGANPSATAGPAAVNGSAATFMRSDGAPAVRLGSASQTGLIECSTGLAVTSGVCSLDLTNPNAWTGKQTFAAVNGAVDVQAGPTYTLLAADCGKTVLFTDNSAVTVTIPASIVPASGTACQIAILQGGTAKVSVNGSAVSAATLISPYSYTGTTGTQGSVIGLTLTTVSAATNAYLTGDGS